MTYLYPTILAVYITLGTFSVELQSEKTNAYEERLLRLLLQALLKIIFLFSKFPCENRHFIFFFHRFGLKQSLGN